MSISKAMKCRIILLKKYGQKGKFYFINSDGQGLEKTAAWDIFKLFYVSWYFSLIFKL